MAEGGIHNFSLGEVVIQYIVSVQMLPAYTALSPVVCIYHIVFAYALLCPFLTE